MITNNFAFMLSSDNIKVGGTLTITDDYMRHTYCCKIISIVSSTHNLDVDFNDLRKTDIKVNNCYGENYYHFSVKDNNCKTYIWAIPVYRIC